MIIFPKYPGSSTSVVHIYMSKIVNKDSTVGFLLPCELIEFEFKKMPLVSLKLIAWLTNINMIGDFR